MLARTVRPEDSKNLFQDINDRAHDLISIKTTVNITSSTQSAASNRIFQFENTLVVHWMLIRSYTMYQSALE